MSERQSFYVGVKAIIPHGDKVLILKDAVYSKWELPGGRVDAKQSIFAALDRELPEEIIGSRLMRLGQIVYAATGEFLVENKHRLCLLFYATEVLLPEIIELSSEHSDYAWVSQENIDEYNTFTADRDAINIFFARNEGEL